MYSLKNSRLASANSSRNSCALSPLLGFSLLALTTLLNTTSASAMSKVTSQENVEYQSLTVASLFGEFFRQAEETLETVTTVNSLINQFTGRQSQSDQELTQPSTENTPVILPSAQTQIAQESDLQILHRDESPSYCQMLGTEEDSNSCKAFQLSKTGNILIFTYYFDAAPISFIAVAEPIQRTESVTGYVTGQMRVANEPIEDVGSCAVAKSITDQYQMVICSAEMGLEFSYRQ